MDNRYLFKAKTYNGKWIEWNILTGIPHDINIINSTICQCTGLKDKNNNLIYENDILDGFTYPYMTDGVHNYYAEICWCTNIPAFGTYTRKYPESKVSGISAGMTELMEDWNPNDWEVIGNIFDNPKLLESERQYERE